MNRETAPDSIRLWSDIWNRTHVRSISLLVKDNLKKHASGAAAAKGKSESKGTRNSGDCVQWTTKGQCPRGHTCGMKHDPDNKREPKGKGRGSRPSSSPRRNSLERGTPTRKHRSGRENQPTCFVFFKGDCPQGSPCDYWHPPVCSFHQRRKLQTWE